MEIHAQIEVFNYKMGNYPQPEDLENVGRAVVSTMDRRQLDLHFPTIPFTHSTLMLGRKNF